jgi:four helix bundle protein
MAGRDNIIRNKSYNFAIRIVELYKYLKDNKREFTLSRQILRSGTSIGANVEEAIGGQSKKDFISKLSIAYKESRETNYWLRILRDTNFITDKEFNSVTNDLNEVQKLLVSIIKTSKRKSEK